MNIKENLNMSISWKFQESFRHLPFCLMKQSYRILLPAFIQKSQMRKLGILSSFLFELRYFKNIFLFPWFEGKKFISVVVKNISLVCI